MSIISIADAVVSAGGMAQSLLSRTGIDSALLLLGPVNRVSSSLPSPQLAHHCVIGLCLYLIPRKK